MDAQTSQAGFGRNLSASLPEAAPLTAEIMDRSRRALDIANEVSSRLYELRNRLFGMPAEQGSEATPPRTNGDCFTAAYGDLARDLNATLNFIDRVSAEIANRL